MAFLSSFQTKIRRFAPGLFSIDWILFLATLPILAAGLFTMNSFTGDNTFFNHQMEWVVVAITLFFILSFIDFRFLRRTGVSVALFFGICSVLVILLVVAETVHGSKSWFSLGGISFQPSDPAKLILILILAKYFSRRHAEIGDFRHVIVSGIYAFILFGLIFLQPDFGSAVIIFLIWFGMILVSGISKKHLFAVFAIGAVTFSVLWFYVFADYQKARIINFIHPLTDIRGSGYNAYQSRIAVGSGELLGKGLGYGTQSRLKFLPEYQTDFVFAAFAEEWGFVGVLILFSFFGIIIWRILLNASHGASNFEILYGLGVTIFLMSHFSIHVGMNIGVLPVTGITLPFMSYGGSHLIAEYAALGILMGMRRYQRPAHKDLMKNEFVGA